MTATLRRAVLVLALLLPGAAAVAAPATFHPPPLTAIPPGPFGREVKLGEEIFRHTHRFAGRYVGADLRCSNCHLDGGRLAGAAPLWAAWVAFPTYRGKTKAVNSFGQRLQDCFHYSMNGTPPPLGSKVLIALEAYSAWLATGAPVRAQLAGRGYPKLPKPAVAPSYARGKAVFAQHCALCHGANGAGQRAGGRQVFPPLWGPHSFNWGAGMGSIANAAAFVKANMPLGAGGSLTDRQAWDVATYLDSQDRPQDPRFTGSVAATRAKYHNSPWSMYGRTVNGRTLGAPGNK
jgi:thiosulfate dehydrogenase